ncbi:hypothetical protein BB560_004696, partial [Smittium megazygosporum]
CTLAALLYIAIYTNQVNENSNIKWGLTAVSLVFIIIGVVVFQNGPFIRPHPVLWRAVLATNILYELCLVYLLFQSKASARQIMKFLDPSLGVPLPEKSYAENCEFNYPNIKYLPSINGMDIFVLAHSLGWFGKALVLRDNFMCWVISILFEFCEYSLEHQLPNFAECWWDHWLLDVLICNWLGIYAGMRFCHYFKTYEWGTFGDAPTIKAKLKRAGAQFTPYSWTSFEWAPTKNLKSYLGYIFFIISFILVELNVFYLKYLLWVPPEHFIVIARLALVFLFGLPAAREYYEFYSNPNRKKLGIHAWMFLITILTELLVIFKFSKGEFNTPSPKHISAIWLSVFSLMVAFPIVKFLILPSFSKSKSKSPRPKK